MRDDGTGEDEREEDAERMVPDADRGNLDVGYQFSIMNINRLSTPRALTYSARRRSADSPTKVRIARAVR